MKDVFISHSTKNKAVADSVVDALDASGISCWIAPRDIAPGSNYGAEITRAIRECPVVVLLFSDDSNSSDAVFREIQKAFEEKKRIVPLRIQDVPVSDDLSFYLSGLQWLDAEPRGKGFDGLVESIQLAINRLPCGNIPIRQANRGISRLSRSLHVRYSCWRRWCLQTG